MAFPPGNWLVMRDVSILFNSSIVGLTPIKTFGPCTERVKLIVLKCGPVQIILNQPIVLFEHWGQGVWI